MAAAAARLQLDLFFPEPPHALLRDDAGQRHSRLALEHELDRDVVPLVQVLVR